MDSPGDLAVESGSVEGEQVSSSQTEINECARPAMDCSPPWAASSRHGIISLKMVHVPPLNSAASPPNRIALDSPVRRLSTISRVSG